MKAVLPLTLALAAAASLAVAAVDIPMPKVMSDAPSQEGKWKMEFVQAPGGARADMAALGSGMMVCTTAGKALARDDPRAQKTDCRFKLLEDSATRAVMETSCPGSSGTAGGTTRTTITRLAPRSYEMSVQQMDKPGDKPMVARMSYVGPCSANDAVLSYDRDSPACRQIRAQLPELEKAKASCAKAGANRASCEQMIQQQLAQFAAMCGGSAGGAPGAGGSGK